MGRFYLRSNNLIFWAILGLMVFIPLYPKFPLFEVSGTYVAIRIEDILIGLVELYWLVINRSRVKQLMSSPLTQSFLVFWLIGFVSLLSGIFITFTVTPHIGLLHFLRRVELMMLFFVAASAIKNTKQLKMLLLTMLTATMIIVLYGLGQVFLQFPVVSTTNREFSKGLILQLTPGARPNSTFAGHYDLAIYLSIILIFLAVGLLKSKQLLEKLGLLVTAGLSFVLLGLTAGRVSLFASLVGISAVLWFTGRKILIIGLVIVTLATVAAIPSLRHRLVATITVNLLEGGGPKYTPPSPKPRIPLSSGLVASHSGLQIASPAADPKLPTDIAPGEPINTTELDVYRSFNIRFNVEWPRAIMALEKNPPLGTGYSSITIATDNDYLRSLGETGFLGTLSLGIIFFTILKVLIKALKGLEDNSLEKLFIIGVICTLLATLISMIFLDVLEASKIASLLWITLGIAWAIVHNYQDDK